MLTLGISIAVFACVAALVGGVAFMFRGDADSAVADRLSALTAGRGKNGKNAKAESSVLTQPLEGAQRPSGRSPQTAELAAIHRSGGRQRPYLEAVDDFADVGWLRRTGLRRTAAIADVSRPDTVPLPGQSALPLAVPDASPPPEKVWTATARSVGIDVTGFAAGHSLGSGIQLVSSEMQEPLGKEFARCFEEQNLGITLEESLESLTERVPNLDLRFFATAVILQRQTGGDLAEILDKIGHLIRERFTIWGQIQALTGEGRLSGIVLLALPPLLFGALYKMNRGYIMKLFDDPLGHKMLAVAVIMQILGAIVIKKIVNIKV